MPDPGEFWSSHSPAWDLAPPHEIRALGDARMRRRRLRSTVAGLSLLLLMAGPLALSVGTPEPEGVVAGGSVSGPAGRADPLTQIIPAGFPIDAGMGGPTARAELTRGGDDTLRDVSICGTTSWSRAQRLATSDSLVASSSEASGAREERVLLVYPDEGTAAAVLLAVRDAAQTCASAHHAAERMIATRPEAGGPWAYVFPGATGPGPRDVRASLLVTRSGNAVLVARWTDQESSGGGLVPAQLLDVLEDMCAFRRGACQTRP